MLVEVLKEAPEEPLLLPDSLSDQLKLELEEGPGLELELDSQSNEDEPVVELELVPMEDE